MFTKLGELDMKPVLERIDAVDLWLAKMHSDVASMWPDGVGARVMLQADEHAEDRHKEWLRKDSTRRIGAKFNDIPDKDEPYQMIEQRIIPMLLSAIPKGVTDELESARTTTSTRLATRRLRAAAEIQSLARILFEVRCVCYQGEPVERLECLKAVARHDEPAPSDKAAAYKAWMGWMRTIAVLGSFGIQEPDVTVLLEGMKTILAPIFKALPHIAEVRFEVDEEGRGAISLLLEVAEVRGLGDESAQKEPHHPDEGGDDMSRSESQGCSGAARQATAAGSRRRYEAFGGTDGLVQGEWGLRSLGLRLRMRTRR